MTQPARPRPPHSRRDGFLLLGVVAMFAALAFVGSHIHGPSSDVCEREWQDNKAQVYNVRLPDLGHADYLASCRSALKLDEQLNHLP